MSLLTKSAVTVAVAAVLVALPLFAQAGAADTCERHFRNFNLGAKLERAVKKTWPSTDDHELQCAPAFIFMFSSLNIINERVYQSAQIIEACSDKFRPGTSSEKIKERIRETAALVATARSAERIQLCAKVYPNAAVKYGPHLERLRRDWARLRKEFPVE